MSNTTLKEPLAALFCAPDKKGMGGKMSGAPRGNYGEYATEKDTAKAVSFVFILLCGDRGSVYHTL